ncbi:MAG: DUF4058 family protein [Chloroflexota bacterium]
MSETAVRHTSPFPGMDPYLEAPDIWLDFHERLASVISETLNEQLPEPYYSRLQMRPEVGVVLQAGVPQRIIPDVTVVRYPTPPLSPGVAVASAVAEPPTPVAQGMTVRIHTDLLRHPFVEIRDVSRGHQLVTLIEIVSPSNKHPGPDRRAYETKQREVLESDANLVEIDLLRSGRRLLPYPELEEAVYHLGCNYLILLNRFRQRMDTWMDYILHPIDVRESLPCISIPLAGDDPDVPLDLQAVFHLIYQRALYRRIVDYSTPPDPPLADEDAAWAAERLRASVLLAH